MIIERMTNHEYHAAPGISKSGLALIMRSPAHFMFQEKRASSRAFVIGSAAHAAILEPELFAAQYMLLREVTDRRASAYKQAAAVHGEKCTHLINGPLQRLVLHRRMPLVVCTKRGR